MSPLVSLIIPVYNAAPYLRRCLDSVLAQTFPSIEVILVNDGSTDGSAKICDEYAAQDVRFRVFHEQNRGSSQARRFGICQGVGEWLAFLDSDDDVHPDYIALLYRSVQQLGTKIAACDMQRVEAGADPIVPRVANPLLLDSHQLHNRFFRYSFWGFWGKIYHKSLFTDKLFFPPYNINEDYVVMAQLFSRIPNIAYVPAPLYYYRQNGDSQSHAGLNPRVMDEYHNKQWVVDFYRHIGSPYLSQAEAQLAETCVKLVGVIEKEDKECQYEAELRRLKSWLRSKMFTLLLSRHLVVGVKWMALRQLL